MASEARRLESDAMLAEMRQRIANSFQLIIALIEARRETVQGDEARSQLDWLRNAVETLALMHEGMAGPSGNLDGHLREATAMWRRIGAEHGITVHTRIAEPVRVPERCATALALAAHELVRNGIEHAFPEGGPGAISIRLGRLADGQGEISVSDDGCGMGVGTAILSSCAGRKGSGLRLVASLASELGGTVEVLHRDPPGTTARLTFRL